MIDSVPTRFGMLDSVLALATRHAIAVAATPALLVLDDTHLRLGIANISTGVAPPTERPSDRWLILMRQLFRRDPDDGWANGNSRGVSPPWSAAPRGVAGRLRRADEKDRKVICRLLCGAAGWLLAQQTILEETVVLAGRVYHRRPRPFALVPTPAVERLWRVSSSTSILLNHAEPDRVDCLLRARYDAVFGVCHPGRAGSTHGRPTTATTAGDTW